MKKISLLLFAAVAVTACKDQKKETYQAPKPGTVVAKDQQPITNNPTHANFSVQVIADTDVAHGTYDVAADYAGNALVSKFTMPKGLEGAEPVLRRAPQPYTYVIGFHQPGDTTFYDYFQVSVADELIKMKYIKSYSAQ